MRKQLRQYLRRSLCGILSAAMILTGSAIPDMAVQAAQTNVEDSAEADEQINETPSTGTNENDEIVNPDADNDAADGAENGDQEDSGQKDEEASTDDVDSDDQSGESEGTTDDDTDLADDDNTDDGKDDGATNVTAPVSKENIKSVMELEDDGIGNAKQFYFYYEPAENEESFELGVEIWGTGITTTQNEMTEWKYIGDDGTEQTTCYIMKSVEGYANWYTIDLTISDEVTDSGSSSGFNIHKKVIGKDAEEDTEETEDAKKAKQIAQFSGWKNPDIYKELLGENIVSYAVKDWKGYPDDGTTDMVTAIMRQVTLHVYDDKGTPSIAYKGTDKDGKLIPLSYFNDGKKEDLTASVTESWANRYDFSADDEQTNWYHLTFIVPESFGAEDIQLYTKDSNGTYTWVVNFTEGNFADVFKGKVYYKDKAFSDAIEDESQADGDITFYYYLEGATENEEVGLYCKDSKVTTTATAADWKVNTNDTVHLFKAVTGYAGWYSIPIHLEDAGKESGFEVYVKSASGTPKVKYNATDNGEIYAQMVEGKNKTCAYKKGISYIGTDETTKVDKVAAIVRNVTVNVYSEDMIPVIQLDKDSAAKALYKVDETDGSISLINSSGNDGSTSNNPVYDMEKMQDAENWYTLTFSVPGAINLDKKKICGLYGKTSDGYSWLQDLANGYTEANKTWEFDFTPVFDGKVWCKYEHSTNKEERELKFYFTKDEAESVTLAQLKELLASDELKKIENKGESGYTADSWTAYSEAKNAATKVVSDNADKAEDFSSTAITTAYKDLKSAMNAMESLSVDVTFYYYAGDMEKDEEIGLYHWGTDLTSTAAPASWNSWGENDTYSMAAVEGYAGWYSIPISFTHDGKDAGFGIFKKSVAKLDKDDTNKKAEYTCEAEKGDTEFFGKVTSGAATDYAVKNGKGYAGSMATSIMRQVTLHVYNATNTPYLHMGKATATSLSVVNETTGELSPLEAVTVTESDGATNNAYALQQDETYKNWYYITFSAPGKFKVDSTEKVCNLYQKDSSGSYKWVKDFMNGQTGDDWTADFTPVFAGLTYYKDGKFYATLEEADPNVLILLQKLVDEAKKLKKDDYKENGWKEFTDALAAAEAVLQAAKDAETDTTKTAPSEEEIQKAYDNLKKAMDSLIPASVQQAEINVKKVALTDDFITGADISSYYALKESGVVFKDEKGNPLSDQGFFDYLYEGGMNWARIRIWNDPYNSSGKGYGGGNNDLEKAKVIGKWASNAGMKVLIDFHYSDFWADPSKQKAPKAWAGYSVAEKEDAVYKFTLESLQELRNAGVKVGMVQVGNETNNGICGETKWENMAKLFSAGSKAVREFDKECLVAVHFTDPQNGYGAIASHLDEYKVDYDVFASSYYPFGHGDAANLRDVLKYVAETYGKKVMAAETSWPTTLVDGDGYGTATPPTVPEKYKDQDYGVSVQGQADEMYDLIKAVNEINDEYAGSSLGVFYWEPAWISPYYIKDDEGNDIDSLYKQNFDLWEKYGSGWASSYAAEYDPDDAGVWFGGSAMDNSSWFDFDGTALPTAKIYSLIRTGAMAERKIASVDSNPVMKVNLGEDIDWANVTVTAKYNDGTKAELAVAWEENETELVNTYKAGEYIVHGIVSEGGKNYNIKLTVQVLRAAANNILVNPDFENNSVAPWVVDKRLGDAGENDVVRVTDEDPHGGELGLHFYSKIGLDFTVSQTVTPEAGTYTFGSYIQGGGADREDVQYAFVKVTDKDGKLKSNLKTAFALNGWRNWVNPEITGITVEAGDTLEVGLIMKSTQDGAWGTMDDFYLYGTHTVSIAEGIEHGTVATNVVKANSGEKIIVTVTPDGGYYPAKVILSGASIKADTLTSSNGDVAYVPATGETTDNQAVLTYTEKTAEEKSETFMMPNGNVTVSAEFVSVFEAGTEKISLKDKENGKYLVEVNAAESKNPTGEAPIADQFYTGKNVTPAVELSYKGYKLTSADYTVKYENNKNKTTDDSKAKIILTAKGDKFAGTREILFEIKEDTRNNFNAKTLKVVYESPDKGTASKATYYLGNQKEVEPKIGLYAISDTELKNPINPDMYEVYYQNNKKVGKSTLVVLPSEEAMGKPDGYKEGSITSTFTIAKCPINQQDVTITMSDKPSYYTGRKAEPAVTVTYKYTDQNGNDQTVTLVKGRDYTVSYTNNVNASVYEVKDEQGNTTGYQDINPKKVPTVKITGKGNYAGARTTFTVDEKGKAGTDKITFKIYPRSITNTTITVADLAESTKAQAPKITVKDGGKAVAASQYVIEEIVRTHDGQDKALDEADAANTIYSRAKGTGTPKVTAAGTYKITIAGKAKSNYTDISNELTFKVVTKNNLIANTKITINGKFYYSGDAITLSTSAPSGEKPNLTVKAGTETLDGFVSRSAAKDNDGVEQDGYYVTYSNNVSAGKATITVHGTGKYVGTKTATFTINKRTIAKQVSDSDKNKKGVIQTPKLSVKVAEEKLDGVWVADAADVADDAKGALINSDNTQKEERGSLEVPYTGYTINPDFKFYSDNYYVDLKEGQANVKEIATGDYTVSYKVGKWSNGKAPVTVTVKGKGNYSGSVKFDNLFTLTERDFSKLSIEVASATYNGKALKPAVTFYNEDGKVVNLKLNTAYTISYKNNKEANQKPDKQPTVTVKQKGKGWGSANGSITKTFTIEQAEITRADIEDVKFQTFLGKALKPKVTVKVNGRKLKEGKDYTLAYSKNVKRGGTATVTITGKDNYFTRQPIVKNFVIK